MADVRLIDANSVCKKIVESIRHAEEWANEARVQQDIHGLRCATEAKTSLLAMLARIHDEPTVEHNAHWEVSPNHKPPTKLFVCSHCRNEVKTQYFSYSCYYRFCPNCGYSMLESEENKDE